MTDERFEELMRDAAHTYRTPPEPDIEAMWDAVTVAAATAGGQEDGRTGGRELRFPGISSRAPRYLAIAATLVIGIALGRASMMLGSARATAAVPAIQTVASANTRIAQGAPYDLETSRYLGQTAALLIALPSEARGGRTDEQFVGRAGELLTRTRLLLDSPAASDPQMRGLLEDLELVLAQVVRLEYNTTNRTELDLINRALEQRDVIPRLRTAVADISAN